MNDINTLRDALFATLAGLQDKAKPMDIERARAINETGQVIINSVKAESDYLKATGQNEGSGFITAPVAALPALPNHATAQSSSPLKTAEPLRIAAVPKLPHGTTRTGHGTKTTERVPGGSVTAHRMK